MDGVMFCVDIGDEDHWITVIDTYKKLQSFLEGVTEEKFDDVLQICTEKGTFPCTFKIDVTRENSRACEKFLSELDEGDYEILDDVLEMGIEVEVYGYPYLALGQVHSDSVSIDLQYVSPYLKRKFYERGG